MAMVPGSEADRAVRLFVEYITLLPGSRCPFDGCTRDIDRCFAYCSRTKRNRHKYGADFMTAFTNYHHVGKATDAFMDFAFSQNVESPKSVLLRGSSRIEAFFYDEPEVKERLLKWIHLGSYGDLIVQTRWNTDRSYPIDMDILYDVEEMEGKELEVAEAACLCLAANMHNVAVKVNDAVAWRRGCARLKSIAMTKVDKDDRSQQPLAKAKEAALLALAAAYMKISSARPLAEAMNEIFHEDEDFMPELIAFMRRARGRVPDIKGRSATVLCPWIKLGRYEVLKKWLGEEHITERLEVGQMYSLFGTV